jgi:hypothetical protein
VTGPCVLLCGFLCSKPTEIPFQFDLSTMEVYDSYEGDTFAVRCVLGCERGVLMGCVCVKPNVSLSASLQPRRFNHSFATLVHV